MSRGAVRLDLSMDGVPELLADFEALSLLGSLGRSRGWKTMSAIGAMPGARVADLPAALARLVTLGLVERSARGPSRSAAYRAANAPLVVTFDPADPRTSYRLAAARLALMGHLRRLGSARASRAARKGAGWRRESVAVLPLDEESMEVVRACLGRIDACLQAASETADSSATAGKDDRPCFRVQVSVDPVEARSVSIPVVLLMARDEASSRTRAGGVAARPRLSGREREVAEALSSGLTKREAAAKLGLTFASVNTLTVRAYRKLGITRRAQLAAALDA